MTQTTGRKDPKREAYSAATTRLRDEFRQRFNELLIEEMGKRGVNWSPRPTEEQKAEQEVADLLARFPELREKFLNANA
jgi:hypothetical protein